MAIGLEETEEISVAELACSKEKELIRESEERWHYSATLKLQDRLM